MYYSSVAFLAIIVLFITNRDIMFRKAKDDKKQTKMYRFLMFGILAYYKHIVILFAHHHGAELQAVV